MKLATFFLLFISPSLFAYDDYKCIISNILNSDVSGNLIEVERYSVGKMFTINRKTGLTSGALTNSFLNAPLVLDRGSKDNSFKAITTMRNDITTNVYVLVVEEYIEGNQKPFIFINNTTVYHGLCEHF